MLWLPAKSGKLSPVFPDILRQALYAIPDVPRLYRIEQDGMVWQIHLNGGDPASVRGALEAMIRKLELKLPAFDFAPWVDQPPHEKQKRIRCLSMPA